MSIAIPESPTKKSEPKEKLTNLELEAKKIIYFTIYTRIRARFQNFQED
jgi:hypothetical protein